MGFKTINQLTAELQRRVEQLTAPAAEAAIIRALTAVHDSGSWTFDLTGTQNGVVSVVANPGEATVGELVLNANVDTRKALFVSNTNGLPIFKEPITHLWETFALNFNLGESYGTYSIAGRSLLLRPGNAQTIGIRYHVIFSPPAGNDFTRLSPQLDELVIDLAEAKERMIYSVGDVWIKLYELTIASMAKALDGFSSTTREQMPVFESVQAVQEATQIGRA